MQQKYFFCFKFEQPIWCSHAGYQQRAEKGDFMKQYEHACVTYARPVPGFTNTNPHGAAMLVTKEEQKKYVFMMEYQQILASHTPERFVISQAQTTRH